MTTDLGFYSLDIYESFNNMPEHGMSLHVLLEAVVATHNTPQIALEPHISSVAIRFDSTTGTFVRSTQPFLSRLYRKTTRVNANQEPTKTIGGKLDTPCSGNHRGCMYVHTAIYTRHDKGTTPERMDG